MQVADIMTRPVITVTPDTSVREIIDLMKKHHITTLPVLDGERLVGVVTESDLLLKQASLHMPAYISFLDSIFPLTGLQQLEEQLQKLAGNRARQIMTPSPMTIRETESTSAAASLMTEHKLLSLPVVDAQGKLIGILSQGDIVRSLAQ